jgi:hypothetical protein
VVGQAWNCTTPWPSLIRRHCSGQLCAEWTQLRHHQRAPARRERREALGQRLVMAAAWRVWVEATGFMAWVRWVGVPDGLRRAVGSVAQLVTIDFNNSQLQPIKPNCYQGINGV